MQKVVLQAAADHHLEFAAVARTRFRNGSVRRYAITTLSTNAGKLWLSHSTGDRFCQHVHVGCASGDDAIYLLHGCHGLCRTLSPFPPRRHICKDGYAFCLLTTEYFFRLSR